MVTGHAVFSGLIHNLGVGLIGEYELFDHATYATNAPKDGTLVITAALSHLLNTNEVSYLLSTPPLDTIICQRDMTHPIS